MVQSPTALAIVGVNVEVGDGTTLTAANVIVIGDRIHAVALDAPVPAGATVVDGKGKTLYPGFIDAFQARSLKNFTPPATPPRPGTDVTAPPTMWLENRKGVYADYRAVDNLEFEPSAGSGVTASLVGLNRGAIRGTTVLVESLPSSDKERVVTPDLGMGMSFRIGPGQGYPSNILGAISFLRQTLSDAKTGAGMDPSAKEKPDWTKALLALKPAVEGTIPVFFEANQSREIERVFNLADEFGFKPILLGGREAGRVAAVIKERGVAVILTNDVGTEPPAEARTNIDPRDRIPDAVRAERRARWLEIATGDQRLAEAGVLFAFSSEGAGRDGVLSVARARIVRGLDRRTALKALTTNAAQILGVGEQMGLIKVGFKGNLVLMDGDFTRESSKVLATYVRGRAVAGAAR